MTTFRKPASVLAAALLLVAACDDDRTTTFEPVELPSIDFGVGGAVANLPAGTVTLGATSVTLTLTSLRALNTGAAYQFWVVGRDTANLDVPSAAFGTILEFFLRDSTDAGAIVTDPVTGDPILVTDTNVVSTTNTNAYAGTDDPAVFGIEVVLDSTADGSTAAANHAVVVTLEPTSGATSPGDARFLFRRIGIGGGGPLSFGEFGGSDVISVVSPNDRIYTVVGGGRGGVRGDEFDVEFEGIARPPRGFFYRGYLVDADGNGTLVDTLRSSFSPTESLSRVSLFDADANPLLPGVTATGIRSGEVRACVAGSGVRNCPNTLALNPSVPANPFGDFLTFVLTLDPKGAGDDLGETTTLGGDIPDAIKN